MQFVETGRGRKNGCLWIEVAVFADDAVTEHRRTSETFSCGQCSEPHPVEIPRDAPLHSVVVVAETADGDDETVAAQLRAEAEMRLKQPA